MVIFIKLVQYAKNFGGKSRKNLVEHQIIKNDKKFNSIICRFFAPHKCNRLNVLSWLWGAKKRQMMLLNFLTIGLKRIT